LLVLRCATALSLALVSHTAGELADTASVLARCAVGGVAVLIWIGLWTPAVAIAGAAIQILLMAYGGRVDLPLLVFAGAALSLAMLGPGAWSLDARFFGRKRII
jgi:putative oxidoreductase